MNRTMRKDVLRSIKSGLGRFLSISFIVAIGCGLFAGVRSSGDEMRATADRYFDDAVLADAQIYSPIGFYSDDPDLFLDIDGVDRFMPGCAVTVESVYGNETRIVRVQSLSAGKEYDLINLPQPVTGRLPERPDECVVERRAIEDGSYSVGDTVHVRIERQSYESMFLREETFRIVGSIDSPSYLSFSWSAISIGSKEPRYNIFTTADAFHTDRYTHLYFTFTGSADEYCYSPEYDEIIEKGLKKIRFAAEGWLTDRYLAFTGQQKGSDSGQEEGSQDTVPENLIREFFESGAKPYYILTRDDVQGYTLFHNDTQRVDGLAEVFPGFFFLVSALVCLTTMTRMVDEERTRIGVLKALGYKTGSIAMKYVIYAAAAAISGSISGVIIGFQVFPRVIFRPYLIMYRLPPIEPVFRLEHAWLTVLIAVTSIVASAVFAILMTMITKPAELMRPKPPLTGRSFAFERIGLIWKRLSFIHKVTIRNLLRYGKRFVMTALGVAGCTALILTGFGLKDAVNDIVDKQFDEILTHDLRVYLSSPTRDAEEDPAILLLRKTEGVTDICPVSALPVTIENATGDEQGASLIIPADKTLFEEYYCLRERQSRKQIRIPDDGVVISEKAAVLLGLYRGDTVRFAVEGHREFEAVITGIAENYIDHYVYLSPSLAREKLGESFDFNVVLIQTNRTDVAGLEESASEILEKPEFSVVVNYSGVKAQMHEIFRNLDSVIYVLTGSAFALAAIVLYNLTNINVRERIREIATLKVLGFFDPEVSAYVFRENAALTVIGAGIGLLLGILMHSSVIRTAEVDMIMFGREIRPASFLLAFFVTCGFSLLIHGIMHFFLKRIKMVESLKSVE